MFEIPRRQIYGLMNIRIYCRAQLHIRVSGALEVRNVGRNDVLWEKSEFPAALNCLLWQWSL